MDRSNPYQETPKIRAAPRGGDDRRHREAEVRTRAQREDGSGGPGDLKAKKSPQEETPKKDASWFCRVLLVLLLPVLMIIMNIMVIIIIIMMVIITIHFVFQGIMSTLYRKGGVCGRPVCFLKRYP